jgi:hypothetical protein
LERHTEEFAVPTVRRGKRHFYGPDFLIEIEAIAGA